MPMKGRAGGLEKAWRCMVVVVVVVVVVSGGGGE